MKAGLLLTGNGALTYLTSHSNFIDDDLIKKFENKGITKFVAYELMVDEARKRYGKHFDIAVQDFHEPADLHILDYEGSRAFRMFSFKEMGEAVIYEKEEKLTND